MGIFKDRVNRDIEETGIKQSDFNSRTDGKVTQSTISGIMRDVVPQKPDIIETIAEVLNQDVNEYKYLAIKDIMSQKLAQFGIDFDMFCGFQKDYVTNKLPVFELEDLPDVLSSKGFPLEDARPVKVIETPMDLGKYAYGFIIKDPGISEITKWFTDGNIAIVSQTEKLLKIDYGIVSSEKDGILVGEMWTSSGETVVQLENPYRSVSIKSKDLQFKHKIVGVYMNYSDE